MKQTFFLGCQLLSIGLGFLFKLNLHLIKRFFGLKCTLFYDCFGLTLSFGKNFFGILLNGIYSVFYDFLAEKGTQTDACNEA